MIPYLIMFIHFTVANNKTPHWTVFNQQDQKLNIYHLISFMRFKWIRWNVTWINGVSIFVYFLKLKSEICFHVERPGVGWCHPSVHQQSGSLLPAGSWTGTCGSSKGEWTLAVEILVWHSSPGFFQPYKWTWRESVILDWPQALKFCMVW